MLAYARIVPIFKNGAIFGSTKINNNIYIFTVFNQDIMQCSDEVEKKKFETNVS